MQRPVGNSSSAREDDTAFDTELSSLLDGLRARGVALPNYEEGGEVEDNEPDLLDEGDDGAGLTDEQLDKLAAGDDDEQDQGSVDEVSAQSRHPSGGLTDAEMDALAGGEKSGGLTDAEMDALAAKKPAKDYGALETVGMHAAAGAAPALISIPGMAAGAAAGAALGSFGGPAAPITVPAGTIIGGIAGGGVLGYIGAKIQEKILASLGYDKSVGEALHESEEQNPKSAMLGGALPWAATFKIGATPAIAQRVLMGGVGAVVEAGGEAVQGNDLSPGKILTAAGTAAAFNEPRSLTKRVIDPIEQQVKRVLPGRPGVASTPQKDQDSQDGASSPPPTTSVGTAEPRPKPRADIEPAAPPENRAESDGGSTGKYAKKPETPTTAPISDEVDPTLLSALKGKVDQLLAREPTATPEEAQVAPAAEVAKPPVAESAAPAVPEKPAGPAARVYEEAPANTYKHPDVAAEIDHTFSVPEGVGISKDGGKIYVDPEIPPHVFVNGAEGGTPKPLNPAVPLGIRQYFEAQGIANLLELRNKRLPDNAPESLKRHAEQIKALSDEQVYKAAREEVGEAAQDHWLAEHGFDPEDFARKIKPFLKNAAKAEPGKRNPPPDLYTRPRIKAENTQARIEPEKPVTAAVTETLPSPKATQRPAKGDLIAQAHRAIDEHVKAHPAEAETFEKVKGLIKTPEHAKKILNRVAPRATTELGAKPGSETMARSQNKGVEAARSAFEKFPHDVANKGTSIPERTALLERVKAAIAHAREIAPPYERIIHKVTEEPGGMRGVAEGKGTAAGIVDPLRIMPRMADEPSMIWLRKAFKLVETAEKSKTGLPSPAASKKFIADELLSRSGKEAAGALRREDAMSLGTKGKRIETPAEDISFVSGEPRMQSEIDPAAQRKGQAAYNEQHENYGVSFETPRAKTGEKFKVELKKNRSVTTKQVADGIAAWRANKPVRKVEQPEAPVTFGKRKPTEAVAPVHDTRMMVFGEKMDVAPLVTAPLSKFIGNLETGIPGRLGMWRQALAKRLVEMAGDVPVHIVSEADMIKANENSKPVDGFYDPIEHQIFVHENARHNRDYVIAHEAIHAVTNRALTFSKPWLRAVQDLMAEVKAQKPELAKEYGMKNEDEFLAEAMTSSKFQQELEGLKISEAMANRLNMAQWKDKTLWGTFVDMARKLIGLPKDGFTAFEAAMRATDDLSKLKLDKQQETQLRSEREMDIGTRNAARQALQQKPGTDNVKEYATSLWKGFLQLGKGKTQTDIHLKQMVDAIPIELRSADVLEKVYTANEHRNVTRDDTLYKALSPAEKELSDTLQRLRGASKNALAEIRKADPATAEEMEDLTLHTSRLADRHGNPYDSPDPFNDVTDPVMGTGRTLHKQADTLKSQKFFTLEKNGEIKVVTPADAGFVEWSNYKSKFVPHDAEIKVGETIDGWTVRKSLTSEIEANATFADGKPAKYHKNDIFSAVKEYRDLAAVRDNMRALDAIKRDPQFLRFSSNKAKDGYERIESIPQFNNVWVPKEWKYAFDDFHKSGLIPSEKLRNLSRTLTGLMFWWPVAHIFNAGAHWFVGRGFDWSPVQVGEQGGLRAYKSLFKDGHDAIKDVITQGPIQQEIREHGGGLVFDGIYAQNLMQWVAKMVSMEVKHDPSKWQKIAKATGLESAITLKNAIYQQSSKVLWAANDVMYTQRYLELTRGKGWSPEKAIKEIEKDFPNYRVPPTVLNSRILSQIMQDPVLMAFGRYHYGVYNALAHNVRDLTKGTNEERVATVGKLFALGLLAFAVKPALDAGAKLVTGNEDAEARPRGPLAPIEHAHKLLAGKEGPEGFVGGAFTPTTLASLAFEMIRNKDFAGRNIVEPTDLTDPTKAGRALTQAAGHVARGAISPFGTFAGGHTRDQSVLETLRDQMLDIKNPSQRTTKYEHAGRFKKQIANDKARFKRPRGPEEELYNSIFGR